MQAPRRLRELPKASNRTSVETLFGRFIMRVNAWLSALSLLGFATSPAIAQDRLKIQNIVGGSVVVLIRNAEGCSKDLVLRSSGEATLGNLRPPAGCAAEIAIFSQGNAMYLESPVNTWTDGSGDVHTVKLQPSIDVRVSVWVPNETLVKRAAKEMETAKDLYKKNMVGVRFVPNIRLISSVSTDPNAIKIISDGIQAVQNDLVCQNLGTIKGREFFTAGTLNVYYVDKEFTGRNCAILATPPVCTKDATAFPPGDGNITFIGSKATSTTLAHEFGHAFGLRPRDCGAHTNDLPGFGPENIMAAQGGDERVQFSLGQVFRMNTHMDQWGGTMLIANRLRPAPGRECPLNLPRSATCPALNAKWPD